MVNQSAFIVIRLLTVLGLATQFTACGSGSNEEVVLSATLAFERLTSPAAGFEVVMRVEDQFGVPASALTVRIESSCGTISSVSDGGDGTYLATVTPPGAGECDITAAIDAYNVQINRRAVVFDEIGADWNQPQAVEGLVNSGAWEDGAHITRDGEWLIIHYIAVSFSCIHESNDAACAIAAGPWQAPERPDFPAVTKIDPDGTVHNSCPTLGVSEEVLNQAGGRVVPQAMYGFRRQPDGSFAEPFVITFADADGCYGIFGPTVYPAGDGSAELLFAFDHPDDQDTPDDSAPDLYHASITLGQPTYLGTFTGPYSLDGFTGLPVGGVRRPGQQGNPSAFGFSDGQFESIWFDDESQADTNRDLLVSLNAAPGSFDDATWSAPITLPMGVNSAGVEEIQPFFDGQRLTYRRGDSIVSSVLTTSDADVTLAASWSTPSTDLRVTPVNPALPGAIVTIGEPTVAMRDGKRILYFVYLIRRADGLLDLDVAFVPER